MKKHKLKTPTIRHIGLVVKNIDKSKFFWCHFFKFKVIKKMKENGKELDDILKIKNVEVNTYKLKDKNNNILELLDFKKKRRIKKLNTNDYGFSHIALNVKKLDSKYVQMKNMGVKFNSKPIVSKDSKVKMTYCITPEGAYLELVENLKL